MFLVKIYFVLTLLGNMIYCRASSSSDSWHLVANFTRNWLNNWTQETELKYSSVLLESNVSSKCYHSIKQFLTKLKLFDPNAVQMFDSSGKIPSGLLQGSWTDLGAFDECLALSSSQYCLVYSKIPLIWSRKYEGFFHPRNQQIENHYHNQTFHRLISQYGHYFLQMNITTGVCLPLGCSVDELRLLLISGLSSHHSGLKFDVDSCQTHSYPVPWKKHEIIAASILLGVVIANIIGSFTSSVPIFRFFNVPSNLDKVLSSPQHTPFPCLGGIKSLTMIYLICGHVVWGLLFNSFDQLFALPSTLVNPLGLSILLGPNTVETFFLVNGLEMMTLFLNKSPSSLSSSPYFSLTIFLLLRWFRFAITVGWFICINIIVFSDHFRVAFGGPFWHYLQSAASISSTCASTWLNHLFLISHHFNIPENWNTCLLADWYLEVDFIYVMLFVFFIVPFLRNKPFKAILNSTLIILIGTLITTLITIIYDVQTSWLPTNFVSHQFTKYLVYIHSKPWAHVYPYFIGVILAFAVNSDKPKINKKLIRLGWLIFWLSVFTINFYEIATNINLFPVKRAFAILYGSIFRLIWSFFISWLIYACHYSLTWSWLKKFLCSKFLGVLSRFNLNALFANFLIVRLNNATQRSLINLSLSTILFSYNVPILFQTYFISAVFTVLVDKPVTRIMIDSIRKNFTINDNNDKQNQKLPLSTVN